MGNLGKDRGAKGKLESRGADKLRNWNGTGTVEDSSETGRTQDFAVGRGGVGEGSNERGRSDGGVMIRAMLREFGGGPRISFGTG